MLFLFLNFRLCSEEFVNVCRVLRIESLGQRECLAGRCAAAAAAAADGFQTTLPSGRDKHAIARTAF